MALRLATAQEWTYQDYRRIPADGRRYEVHEGELWRAPSPITRHQRLVLRLYRLLFQQLENSGLGELFVSPYDVVLAPNTVVQPDLVFVSAERAGIITEENIQGAPDLVVEILSPGTTRIDRTRKRGMYERAGIPEYWVVDGRAGKIDVYSLEPGKARYGQPQLFQGDATVKSSSIRGLEVPLARVWS